LNDPATLSDELRYRLLKLLEETPDISQRELAARLGVSLGKVNYCLRALVARGILKVKNFRNSRNKVAYLYLLTPKGVDARARITYEFLRLRLAEVEALRAEVASLRKRAVEKK
jgi:EPS-associated MarR family transcriptional regulator